MTKHQTFAEIPVGTKFVFAPGQTDNLPDQSWVKTDERHFESEDGTVPGRVGVGDNPVMPKG